MNKQENQASKTLERSYRDAEQERIVCQLKGLIRQAWPEEFGAKRADLKVVKPNGKLVWPKKQRRENLTKVKAAQSRLAVKKGAPKQAEVMHATVLVLPGVYLDDELDERFEFIRNKAGEWGTTDTEGTQAVDWERRAWIEAAHENRHRQPLTDHDKRKQVSEGRARIDTRNRIKTYLERRGLDMGKIHNAEDALFALFVFVESTP